MQKRGNRLSQNWQCVIGLTGGLGSGKSTVLKMFQKKGVLALDSDQIVHDILVSNLTVLREIKRSFGHRAFSPKGGIDRPKLAKIIFASKRARNKLEKILHPLVRKQMRDELLTKTGELVVCDVPLLFEVGWDKNFDKVMVVEAPLKIRQSRLLKRGWSKFDVAQRLKAQWPLEKKTKRADFVVDNSGSIAQTQKQVENILRTIRANTPSLSCRS